jgi:hypothetical protein
VLIVCEGEKTEPEYLKGLQKLHRLSNANITIVPGDGNDPVSIVRHALKAGGHANYQEALDLVANSSLGKKGKLAAITSVPCFEIWILLHFGYTAAPFAVAGGRSACDNVIRAIREHMPEYRKALAGVFEQLQPHVETALTHGNRLAQHNRDTGSENPGTKVHELVKYLRELKKP